MCFGLWCVFDFVDFLIWCISVIWFSLLFSFAFAFAWCWFLWLFCGLLVVVFAICLGLDVMFVKYLIVLWLWFIEYEFALCLFVYYWLFGFDCCLFLFAIDVVLFVLSCVVFAGLGICGCFGWVFVGFIGGFVFWLCFFGDCCLKFLLCFIVYDWWFDCLFLIARCLVVVYYYLACDVWFCLNKLCLITIARGCRIVWWLIWFVLLRLECLFGYLVCLTIFCCLGILVMLFLLATVVGGLFSWMVITGFFCICLGVCFVDLFSCELVCCVWV